LIKAVASGRLLFGIHKAFNIFATNKGGRNGNYDKYDEKKGAAIKSKRILGLFPFNFTQVFCFKAK